MRAFVYNAALLCETCGVVVRAELAKPEGADLNNESTFDSGDYPKGPYEQGGGEADSPQHCDHCGVFLANPLTGDGVAYVAEALEPYRDTCTERHWPDVASKCRSAGKEVLAEWADYYADVLPRGSD